MFYQAAGASKEEYIARSQHDCSIFIFVLVFEAKETGGSHTQVHHWVIRLAIILVDVSMPYESLGSGIHVE
jgi:hypothetical protein